MAVKDRWPYIGGGKINIKSKELHESVINFRALLPHMYGDINKLFQCFVELMFFYFLFAHNIYSKLQHCFSIFKPSQGRALHSISKFSQCKPKCLNTVQVACPQH